MTKTDLLQSKGISEKAKLFLLELICTANKLYGWMHIKFRAEMQNYILELLKAKLIEASPLKKKRKIIQDELLIRLNTGR